MRHTVGTVVFCCTLAGALCEVLAAGSSPALYPAAARFGQDSRQPARAAHAHDPWHDTGKSFNVLGWFEGMRQHRALERAIANRHREPIAPQPAPKVVDRGVSPSHGEQAPISHLPRREVAPPLGTPGFASPNAAPVRLEPVVAEGPRFLRQTSFEEPADEPKAEPTPESEVAEPIEPPLPDLIPDSLQDTSEEPMPAVEADLGEPESPEEAFYFQPPSACPKCRLRGWRKMVRLLVNHHRNIPVHSPLNAAPPYYSRTRWQRSPTPAEPVWHSSEPVEADVLEE